MHLVDAFRAQASACAGLGSPMYAELLARVADDLLAGGPSAAVLRGHEDAPGPSAVALRLAGSLHHLVLQRRAGALGAWYPSVGGTWQAESGWAAVRDLLEDRPEAVRELLDQAPQTNEVGRAAALMSGLLRLGPRLGPLPVRLFEIGSSAGLHLLADRFRYVGSPPGAAGPDLGPVDSPVVLDPAWTAPAPEPTSWPKIVERLGSDVRPVDAGTTEGRLRLTAYVWADQIPRLERLQGALGLARQVPPRVRTGSAAELVDGLELVDGTVSVLWHSVMWQYLEMAEQEHVRARIEALGRAATPRAPFAHVFLEPTRRTPQGPHEPLVVLQTWPGERRVLARAPAHGLPLAWEPAAPDS